MSQRRRIGFVGAVSVALAAAAGAGAGDGADYARLLERIAPSVVSLKVILKTEFNMGDTVQDQESVLEARGALVDASGLVLIWNSQLSANRLMETVEQMGSGEDFKLKITPTDFRVTIEGEATERRAFLAASDSDLDLAFLQIDPPPDRPLPAIAFGSAHDLAVGDTVVGVSRLSPGFDRAAFFESARIAGEIRKPRRAWVLDASPALLGLPVFDLRGEAVGVVATVLSRTAEPASHGGDIMSFFALGKGRMENGPLGVFLLPAERVAPLVVLAKQRAGEILAERAASAAPEPPETEN